MNDRSKSIGASEVSALFGESPWVSEYSLFQLKTGLAEPQEESTRLAMGKILERPILEYWAAREGFSVSHNTVSAAHPAQRYLTATPDAFVCEPGAGAEEDGAGGEVKTVRGSQRREWLDGVPSWYFLQAQAQMLVWNLARTHLICCFDFDEISHTVIEADPETQAEILRRVDIFHKRVKGELPPPDVDAHPATMAALMQTKRDAEKSIAFDDTIAALDAELTTMTKRKTSLEKDIRGAKAKILKAMGDATRGVFSDGSSYRVSLVNVKAQTKAAYTYQKLTRLKGDDAVEEDDE